MPDLSNSFEKDGRYYCWDFGKKQLVRVSLEVIDNKEISKEEFDFLIQKLFELKAQEDIT